MLDKDMLISYLNKIKHFHKNEFNKKFKKSNIDSENPNANETVESLVNMGASQALESVLKEIFENKFDVRTH